MLFSVSHAVILEPSQGAQDKPSAVLFLPLFFLLTFASARLCCMALMYHVFTAHKIDWTCSMVLVSAILNAFCILILPLNFHFAILCMTGVFSALLLQTLQMFLYYFL